jgi:TrmH family RNA methyltransferase
MIGNEGRGLSEKILALPNIAISIPKFGKAESLNAGIAASILCAKLKM